ncbi:MAG: hypothetical protein V1744_06750 [Candidatus Altiarchaeota archaeon]
MGFSTITAQLIFFIAVVLVSAGVIATLGYYIDQVMNAMSDKQQYITGQLRTDIVITNIYNSSGDLIIYVKNVGNSQLKTNCTELYVDSGWTDVAENEITDPTSGDPLSYWDPEDTIKLSPAPSTYDSTLSIHEVKFVTCNGISDSENF